VSHADRPSMGREIADTLVRALDPIVHEVAPPAAMAAARGAAQLLGLDGLDRILMTCQVHAGLPWPPEVRPVLERLERLVSECAAAGSIDVFLDADAELALLSAELSALEWSEQPLAGGGRRAVPTLTLADVIKDVALVEGSYERARRVRVTAPVAAALRAALDWLSDEATPPLPLRLSGEESALEIVWTQVNPAGLYPAAKVLGAAGGSLGPSLASDSEARAGRTWAVRIPTFAGRNSYLMLTQGDLRIALPWHATIRLYMVPGAELESSVKALDLPLLDPLAPPSRLVGDCPVVLVAHGLKRAYLVADRLVWRLEAEPCEAPGPSPAAPLTCTVCTDEGEIYWVIDPERLLEGVEAIVPFGQAVERLPVLGPENVEPLPLPTAVPSPEQPGDLVAEPEPPCAAVPAPSTAAEEGSPVPASEPLPARGPDETPDASLPVAESTAPATAPLAPTVPVAATVPPPPSVPPAPRALDLPVAAPATGTPPASPARETPRALVADDSMTARIFLSRLLEQQGFEVRAVSSATELFAELDDGDWSLICLDVELPEGRGTEILKAVAKAPGVISAGTPLVGLVRDAADVAAANVAGVTRTLRKPFERPALEHLLAQINPRNRKGDAHS
jgi:CheY-like chemotaxis protein